MVVRDKTFMITLINGYTFLKLKKKENIYLIKESSGEYSYV